MPVSYTHLDVYKRQSSLCGACRAAFSSARSPAESVSNIGRITDFPENVDYYVHLPDVHRPAQLGDYYLNRSGMVDMPDVYKRQGGFL